MHNTQSSGTVILLLTLTLTPPPIPGTKAETSIAQLPSTSLGLLTALQLHCSAGKRNLPQDTFLTANPNCQKSYEKLLLGRRGIFVLALQQVVFVVGKALDVRVFDRKRKKSVRILIYMDAVSSVNVTLTTTEQCHVWQRCVMIHRWGLTIACLHIVIQGCDRDEYESCIAQQRNVECKLQFSE